MTREELEELGYPSNITQLIEEAEGVELFEEEKDFYVIYDTYEHNDRFLQINKEFEVKEEYFEFYNNDINKARIIEFCKGLPSILFMHLRKIYFVEKFSDMELLEEDSPNHTTDLESNAVGMAVYNDSTVIINLKNLKKLSIKEEVDDLKILGYTNGWERHYYDSIIQTIAHELFHLAQFNPLIEAHIPDGEEAAEEFCRQYS